MSLGRDGQGMDRVLYSQLLLFEKEAAGGACVPPNGPSWTLAEAQQSLSLGFHILL